MVGAMMLIGVVANPLAVWISPGRLRLPMLDRRADRGRRGRQHDPVRLVHLDAAGLVRVIRRSNSAATR